MQSRPMRSAESNCLSKIVVGTLFGGELGLCDSPCVIRILRVQKALQLWNLLKPILVFGDIFYLSSYFLWPITH